MKTVKAGFLILPLLYLGIGGYVTAMLLHRVLDNASTVSLLFLVPMLAMTVLLTVVGIVNVWLQYRAWHDSNLLRQYSSRSLFWLYLKGWGVVMVGLSIGVLFAMLFQILPSYLQELTGILRYLFYALDALLTLVALMTIVLDENLVEIRLQNTQSENQLLKSQLNPHFLYNTLNNIDALIWLDQERASAAVTSLSNLMRYMTYSSRQDEVPLEDEAKAISQLCELQRLRMSIPDALSFELKSDASDFKKKIAPLLFIPLVENCFKHCGETNEPNAINIRLEVKEDRVCFTTDNNVPKDKDAVKERKQDKNHGLGLTVLRRRLDLLYPERYLFSAKQEGDRFRTTLTISC